MSNIDGKKFKWTDVEEKLLINIVQNADKGALRKVLIEKKTNIKMNKQDAWERVR